MDKELKNWNAKRVAAITEKEIREDYKDPTFDLVTRTRKRRLVLAKDLLQADSQLPSVPAQVTATSREPNVTLRPNFVVQWGCNGPKER